MNKLPDSSTCPCNHSRPSERVSNPAPGVVNTIKSLPSILLGVLIALFPKCPICWAVYMSMFGGMGLARLPYMGWLLPVLLLLLAVHLIMLFRQSGRRGYLPFLLSLAGSLLILSSRAYLPTEKWALIVGMVLIGTGSLTNTILTTRVPALNRANKHL